MAWADRSPLERAALDYCAPRGIPLSVFLSRVVYPGEPEWLEDDVLAALDWQAEQASRCPDCGEHTDESRDIENAYAYRAKSLKCHACYAINVEAARLAKGKPHPTAGHRYQVIKAEAN